MKFIFYIFLLSHFLNFISIFAETVKKDSAELNLIKWEKIKEDESNNSENIIWKSYNDDESYFQKSNEESSLIKNKNNIKEKKLYKSQRKLSREITEIESYFPLNNFLKKGAIDTTVQWKSAFSAGASSGTGHQNISVRFDYGLDEKTLASLYLAESDDPLFKHINDEIYQNTWSVFALGTKRKLFESKDSKNSIAFSGSLEYWIITSGKDKNISRSMFNEIDDTKDRDRFTVLVSSFSIPYNRLINSKTTFALVPGVFFLPDTLGNRNINDNFYGSSFYLGTGLNYSLSDEFLISASYTYLFGPGNNYFDENLKFARKPVYSLGIIWNVNPIIGFEGKLTNGYGATPATGLLTIPSANEALYSLGISYKPYLNDTYLLPLREDELFNYGGLTVDNAIMPRRGESQFNIDYDSAGNLFSSYSYSLSNIFQLELINIGTFKTKNTSISKSSRISRTYLSDYNFNYRVGGKLLFLSPEKNDLIGLSSRVSLGRDLHSRQGYIYTDLTSTIKLNEWISFNVSPKYLFSGVGNLGAIGFSKNIKLSNNFQFIGETNFGITKNSDNNSTFSFRYLYSPYRSIDIYTTNALGFQDIGTMLKINDYKFGMRLNYMF